MKKPIGILAGLAAFAILLSGVMAQPPAGGGGKGMNPLASKENFLAKYDTNNDKKVTKDEYMKVATKDAEVLWEAIAGAGGKDVDEAKIDAYIAANPAKGGGKMMGGGKMGKGAKAGG